MRTHTTSFKNEIKAFGRQFNDYYNTGTTFINHLNQTSSNSLLADEINSVRYSYDCNLLKTRMATLEIDSKVEIPIGTIIDYRPGLVINNSTENLLFGKFYVTKVEEQKDTKSYLVTCYDNIIKSMVDYTTPIINGSPITFPITIRDYLVAICNYLSIPTINVSNATFTNYNKQVKSEHYLDADGNSLGYTFRDVLDDIAEATGSFIIISYDSLTFRNIVTTNDTIDEDYFSNKNVNIGKHYGPINTVVLSRANADNLYYPATLPANPCEIKISDNPILEQDNREDFIQGIYNKLNGLEFYLNDFQTNGILYYDIGDIYNASIGGVTYPCLMLNDDITRTTGLKEYIYTDEPKTSVTDYKYASSSDRAEITGRNAYIKVDKAQGQIDQIVTAVGDNGEVTTASIVQSINNAGSQIKLNADKIFINGVTFDNQQNMTITKGTINIEQAPGDRSLYTYYNDGTKTMEGELVPFGVYFDEVDSNDQITYMSQYKSDGADIVGDLTTTGNTTIRGTLYGNDSSRNGKNVSRILDNTYVGTGVNLNNYKQAGQYGLYGNNTNSPTSSICTLEVIEYSPDWVVQILTEVESGKKWQRTWSYGNTWNSWNVIGFGCPYAMYYSRDFTQSFTPWANTQIDFTSGTTSWATNSDDFSLNGNFIRINFNGVILIFRQITHQHSGEFDINDELGAKVGLGYNNNSMSIAGVSPGDNIKFEITTGASSVQIWNVRLFVIRVS